MKMFGLHDARRILTDSGHPSPEDMVLAEANPSTYYLDDVLVNKRYPSSYMKIVAADGVWLYGPDHVVGKDYRCPTNDEQSTFLAGVHLRPRKFETYLRTTQEGK